MYFTILKKDLKRKRTMAVIIFLFTVLAACFVASGINNAVTVMNGTDYFFEKAGVSNFVFVDAGDGKALREEMKKLSCVKGIRQDRVIMAQTSNIWKDEKNEKSEMLLIQSVYRDGLRYFDQDNERITSVKKGEIYLPRKMIDSFEVKYGDTVHLKQNGITKDLVLAGTLKDAVMGAPMMGGSRVLISKEDEKDFVKASDLSVPQGSIFYIQTTDADAVTESCSEVPSIIQCLPGSTLRLAYIMSMIVAMSVLAISVCLILVAFVVLKYVITFSINEEFREIGVMKAIGITNRKIRSLFVVKYACIALAGSVLGFFASIPFGNLQIEAISKNMVLGNDGGIWLNIGGAVFVALLMVSLAYFSTAKVKKYTPLDAIRSGETGERYGKKTKMKLSGSRLGNAHFLAWNDVLSYPKRYITIMISFVLCSVFTFGLVLMADTMRSDKLVESFGTRGDVYLLPESIREDNQNKIIEANAAGIACETDPYDDSVHEIGKKLKENGMPGRVSIELFYSYKVEINGKKKNAFFEKNPYVKMTDYKYEEGTAPKYADEIAITDKIRKEYGVDIGDKVVVEFTTGKKTCLITAVHTTMNQLGDCFLLHTDAPTRPEDVDMTMMYQVSFDDNPSSAVIDQRVEKLKEIFDSDNIMNATDYVVDCMKSADTMDAVTMLLLVITLLVVVLVAILMERSFIADEEGSIAVLRAIGFSERAVIRWHVCRFMIVAVISEVVAVIFTLPVTHLWTDPIWSMMGQTKVEYNFKPLSMFVIYPGIILGCTLAAALGTAVYTRRIKAADVVNIE